MPHVQLAAKALLKVGNRFLIIRQQLPDGNSQWSLPGGRMEYGETPAQTLERELTEELNLQVQVGALAGVWQFVRQIDGDQIVCLTYFCHTNQALNLVPVTLSDEVILEQRLVTREAFLSLPDPIADPSLQHLIEQLELD